MPGDGERGHRGPHAARVQLVRRETPVEEAGGRRVAALGPHSRAYRDLLDDLKTLLGSGVPITEALESLRADRRDVAGEMAARLAEAVRRGETLSGALAEFPWVPEEHIAYVRIGETTGRLDLLLGKIIARLDGLGRMRQELLTRAAYPIVLLVMATVVLPLPLVILGSAGTYLAIVLSSVVPLALIALLIAKGRVLVPPGSPARPGIERALLGAPGLGRVLGDASLGRALGCLGNLIEAGASLNDSLELSARVSGWETLRAELRSVESGIRSGRTLSEALGSCPAFRERRGVIARIATGEKAGRLDEALLRAGEDLEDRAFAKTITAVRIVPFLLFPLVGVLVLLAGLRVFSGVYGSF